MTVEITGTALPLPSAMTPESIAKYLKGAPAESAQFDFFIGRWNCQLRISPPTDDPPIELAGEWNAKWVHDRRMIVDDLSVFLPTGEEVLAWVNLRTFCADTNRWEISAQRALEPATGTRTQARQQGDEMHLFFETNSAVGRLANRVRFHNITRDSFDWRWEHRAASAIDDSWSCPITMRARRSVIGAGTSGRS